MLDQSRLLGGWNLVAWLMSSIRRTSLITGK